MALLVLVLISLDPFLGLSFGPLLYLVRMAWVVLTRVGELVLVWPTGAMVWW